jgi:protein-S-isoprenylcysteine O-methyltransferase Ste14
MSTHSRIEPNLLAGILARFGQVVILLLVQGIILFLAAGTPKWIWAWAFLGIYLVGMMINGFFLIRANPETIAERGKAKLEKDWDKLIGGLWSLVQFLLLPLVAGLDARFGWTRDLSSNWNLLGAVGFAAGLELFSWALIANAYFSTVARVQKDRGQTVCKTGPYRFVRHPGYVGAILQSLAIPLLLGSIWALIPGVIAAALMAARTSFEDRMLQEELSGYKDYAREVRYRLVPGVW